MATPAHTTHVWRFGVFEADAQKEELRRAGVPVKLREQSFRILVLLLEHAGELVTREDLRKALWPADTYVDFDHSLNTAVMKLREALGDSADKPLYIDTVPKRGYSFIAAVSRLEEGVGQPVHPVLLPEAVPTTPDAGSAHRPSRPARQIGLLAVCALGVVAGLLFALNTGGIRDGALRGFQPKGSRLPITIESIAVLPLENLSGDRDQEYFSDGLTDALITNLGQVGTMRVISRASVMQFKRGKTPVPQIARDLNVDAVVERTVLGSGSRVRISVQLLDARADRHLWARTYEHELEDVINVERQAALAIAHEISGRLTTAQEMRLKSPGLVNPEAYDAYLRGSYQFAERSTEAETSARGYFEQALRSDPNFAPAYGGLALFYSVACGVPSDFPLAEIYAQKALALDPGLPDGHTALGYIRLTQHRYREAENEFQQAISLNPNYALAYDLYADYWLFMGRPTEALAENGKALQLDPFSYAYNYLQSGILYFLGQYNAALEKARFVATLNPQVAGIHEWSVQLYWAAGRVPEALEEQRKVASATHSSQMERDAKEVAAVNSSSGLRAALMREAALRIQRRTQALHSGAALSGLDGAESIAILYSFLADRENTLHWLDVALREDPGHSPEDFMCSRSFDFVRSDPRFSSFERRLGLPIEGGSESSK